MMKIELENVLPREIEKRSFELITEELGERTFPEEQEPIIKRCIHTSADFEKSSALCQMKMWQRQQRKTGRQEQLPVWTRRQP